MFESIIFGAGYAFAAAVQPGPLQAFLFSRALTSGWKRTLPACFSPLLSDLPIVIVALFVLGRLPLRAQHGLRIAGGVLLVYLAWLTLRQWRGSAEATVQADTSAPRTLVQATAVNLLNPNPYLSWAIVLGPIVVAAWHVRPANAIALLVAFYVTLIVTTAAMVVVVGTARFLNARVQRALIGVSAVVLAALGVYLFVAGVIALRSA